MASPWPGTLPQKFLVDGYSEGVGDGLLEYQPDTGASLTRRRATAMPKPMGGNFEMTSAQIATLKTFFETTLIGGSLPFNFPDPLTGATLLVKFQKGGIPKWSALGGDCYIVGVSLWVLP